MSAMRDPRSRARRRHCPVLVSAAILGATLGASAEAAAAWAQVAALTRPTHLGGDGEGFGGTLACSGGTVLVGAPNEDRYAGAIYAFSGAGYAEVQRIVVPDPGSSDVFGGSISISGDTLVAGSTRIDGGHVRFFVRQDGVWTHQQTILSEGAARTGSFGRAVIVRGDRAVVAAPKEAGDTGRVYVYRRQDGVWAEEAQLSASDGTTSDFFSLSLAFDGDTLLAAAPTNPFLDADRGAVYIFTGQNGVWSQQARLDRTGQDPSPPLLYFGGSAALSGDRVVVSGTAGTDEPVAGRVFIYERSGGSWQLAHTLLSPEDESFGVSVTLQADRIFALRINGDDQVLQEYQRGNGQWSPSQSLPPLPSSSRFELCGGTLVRTNESEVLVYEDATYTGADPTVPPSAAPNPGPSNPESPNATPDPSNPESSTGASGDGDTSRDGGCSFSAQGARTTGAVGLGWVVLLLGLRRWRT